jgi:hypothetical protein
VFDSSQSLLTVSPLLYTPAGRYPEALSRFDEAADSAERMSRASPSPLAVRNRAAALNNAGATCLMLGSRCVLLLCSTAGIFKLCSAA